MSVFIGRGKVGIQHIKFEIRNQKLEEFGARGANYSYFQKSASLTSFEFLISNFEFFPPYSCRRPRTSALGSFFFAICTRIASRSSAARS
jgi:hypothetical protein